MARLYANENVPAQVVKELRGLGHDVLTSFEAGMANAAVPDPEVLAFATVEGRTLLTLNRRHFLRLHQLRTSDHAGIIVCTYDPDFARQAARIHFAVGLEPNLQNKVMRVNRPE